MDKEEMSSGREGEEKRPIDLRKRLRRGLLSLPIAALLPLQFFGAIPLQLYTANAGELKIPLSAVLLYCLGGFALTLLVLTLVGLAFADRWYSCWCAALFAGGVLMYLQSNFWFLDVGILNGQAVDWSTYGSKMNGNLLLWIMAIVVAVLLALKFPKPAGTVTKYGSAALSAMQILVIVLLFIMPGQSEGPATSAVVTTKGFDELSADQNAVLIIMDMFDDTYMTEVLEKNPDLAQKLDGFTRYTNVTGKYSATAYGAPFVITQQPLFNQGGDYWTMLDQAYANSQMLNRLREKGYRFQLYTEESLIGERFKESCYNLVPDSWYTVSDPAYFCKLMTKLSLLRGAPDIVKTRVQLSTDQFDDVVSIQDAELHTTSGILPYQKMINDPIHIVEPPVFSVIHIRGTHYPYMIDENAQQVEEGSVTYYEQALGTMRAVLAYLEHMKEAGVYDNSTIVLTADHGYYESGATTSPVLLAKSRDSRGTLAFDSTPVSQDNIKDIILMDAEDDYTPTQRIGQRTFYSYDLTSGHQAPLHSLTEWYISDESNGLESFTRSGYRIDVDGNRAPLSQYAPYRFGETLPLGEVDVADRYFDYGLGQRRGLKSDMIGSEAKMTFSHEPMAKDMLLAVEYENFQNSDIIVSLICNGVDCGSVVLGAQQGLARWKLSEGCLNTNRSELVLRYEGVEQNWCGVAQKISYKSLTINEYKGEDLSVQPHAVTELGDFQAQMLSYEWEGSDLLVKVKNTSAVNWSYEDRVRCHIRLDGGDSGIRAQLASGEVIAPGEEATFRFAGCLESVPSDHTVEVQMLQEGFAYFGDLMEISFGG